MSLNRLLLMALVLGAVSSPASAIDMFTPGLPASPDQSLSCRIVNVTLLPQVVTSQALDSKGAIVAGLLDQKLAPGGAGGFSVPGLGGAMYCRFRVASDPSGFRVSIEVFETLDGGTFRIVAALPGR